MNSSSTEPNPAPQKIRDRSGAIYVAGALGNYFDKHGYMLDVQVANMILAGNRHPSYEALNDDNTPHMPALKDVGRTFDFDYDAVLNPDL